MGTRYLEKNVSNISLVFLPLDDFDSHKPILEQVEVYLEGVWQTPLYHPEGYIIYMDLPQGNYHVTAGGKYYNLYETFTVDTSTFHPLSDVIQVHMKPRPDYPFPDSATLLRGVVTNDAGTPLEGVRVEVTNPPDMALTDSSGAFVFFFEPGAPTMDIQIRITADGYQEQLHSLTVVESDTINFSTMLVLQFGPDIAFLSGTISNTAGDPVSQARVEVLGQQISSLTDARGTILLAVPLSNATETVDLKITQDGYAERIIQVEATKQLTTPFQAMLSLNLLHNTATLQVDISDGAHPLPDALVEIPQKNRSCYTNSMGRVVFYFNHLVSSSEMVNVVASHDAFVTKSEEELLREGKVTKTRISLPGV